MSKQLNRLEDLTPDPGNANLGTERGAIQVENSLRDYGAGRSIVVDKDGVVIAGNKTLESAADIGLPIEVVQTDGTKLVVVQRTDLKLGSEDNRARLLAYADNRASEVGLHWDVDQIRANLESGINIDEMFRQDEIDELLAIIPKFEPVGEDQQGKLDELAKVKCPECGHEFTR